MVWNASIVDSIGSAIVVTRLIKYSLFIHKIPTHTGTSGSAKRKVAAAKKESDAAMLFMIPWLDTMFAYRCIFVPSSAVIGKEFYTLLFSLAFYQGSHT